MLKLNNEKGAALPIVLIVMLVLIILAAALLNISMANVRQSAYQNNRLQAYNLARSGIELAVRKLQVATEENIYTDITELEPIMIPFGSTTIANLPNASFSVTFVMSGYSVEETVKIVGTGVYSGVTETTSLTLDVSSPYLNPDNWINNGWIVNDGLFSKSDAVIVFRTKKNIGHAVKKVGNTAAPTTFTAKSLHFMDTAESVSLEVVSNRPFTLEANLITFVTQISVPDNGSGELFLNVLGGGSGLIGPDALPLKTGYGVIYLPGGVVKRNGNNYTQVFPSGYYYFNGNTALAGQALNLASVTDRAKLIKIVDANTIKYLEDMIRDETRVKVNYNDSIWAKE